MALATAPGGAYAQGQTCRSIGIGQSLRGVVGVIGFFSGTDDILVVQIADGFIAGRVGLFSRTGEVLRQGQAEARAQCFFIGAGAGRVRGLEEVDILARGHVQILGRGQPGTGHIDVLPGIDRDVVIGRDLAGRILRVGLGVALGRLLIAHEEAGLVQAQDAFHAEAGGKFLLAVGGGVGAAENVGIPSGIDGHVIARAEAGTHNGRVARGRERDVLSGGQCRALAGAARALLFFALGAVEARKGAAPAQAEAGLLFVIPGRGLVFAVHNGHVAVAGHEVDIVHGGQIGGREADALARVQGDVLSDEVGFYLGQRGVALLLGRGTEAQRAHGGLGVAEIGTVLCRGHVDVAAGGHGKVLAADQIGAHHRGVAG